MTPVNTSIGDTDRLMSSVGMRMWTWDGRSGDGLDQIFKQIKKVRPAKV